MLQTYLKNHFILWLIGLTALAVLVRFPYLSQFPPAMLPDEAALGFNAISIAETGKDEWGISWPLQFHSFGDDKPPAYVYATALVYTVIGWTPALPRVTSALSGVLIVVVLTLWLRQITKSDAGALIGGLIAAVSPWTVHLSRSALESNLGLLFFILGLYFLRKTKGNGQKRAISVSSGLATLGFVLSAYSFHSYRLAAPLYLGILSLIEIVSLWKKRVNIRSYMQKPVLWITVLAGLFIMPGLLIGGSTTRFSQTTLLQPTLVNSTMALNRDTCHEMSIQMQIPYLSRACQVIWNPITVSANILFRSFLQHLLPTFIFVSGDPGFARNPTQAGLLFAYLLPAFVIGLYQVYRRFHRYYFLIIGYLVAIIPSALTGPTHSTRLSPLIPFVIAICVLGLIAILKKKTYLYLLVAVSLLLAGGLFLVNYAQVTFGRSSDFVGHSRQLSLVIDKYAANSATVYVDPHALPEPHMYLAFWNQIAPQEYQSMQKFLDPNQLIAERPVQLGSSIFFEEPGFARLICDPKLKQAVVFISPEELHFKPNLIVTNNTRSNSAAFVYEMQSMRLQPGPLFEMCGAGISFK